MTDDQKEKIRAAFEEYWNGTGYLDYSPGGFNHKAFAERVYTAATAKLEEENNRLRERVEECKGRYCRLVDECIKEKQCHK